MLFGKLKLKSINPNNPTSTSFTKSLKQLKQKQQVQKIFEQQLKTKDKITTYQAFNGSGTIITSGTTVIGLQTKFKSQLSNNDFIQLINPLLNTIQQRQVIAVLGDKSILLKQSFIEEANNYTVYKIQKKPKIQKGEDIAEEYAKKLQNIKKTKQITKDTVQLRIKKGMWKYQNQKVEVNKDLSKEQLLDIRAKKIKDKFCW